MAADARARSSARAASNPCAWGAGGQASGPWPPGSARTDGLGLQGRAQAASPSAGRMHGERGVWAMHMRHVTCRVRAGGLQRQAG